MTYGHGRPAADLRALVAREPLAQLGRVQLQLHAGGHGGRLVLGRLCHSSARSFLQRHPSLCHSRFERMQ